MDHSTDTSIGPDDERGGNDNPGNADGCGNKTLGSHSPAAPSAGAEVLEEVAPPVPAGVPGARPRKEVAEGARAWPEGPNVESSPWELDAARGKVAGGR